MQPNEARNDQFTPKWRHFHPQAIVWVQNPLEHDVVFQAADELNRQWTYRMPSGKVAELPGGAIATLGVKRLVDELIQRDPKDVFNMWNADTRAKYEDQVIVRIKDAPADQNTMTETGEVNLATNSDEVADEQPEESTPEVEEETPFEEVDDEPTAEVVEEVNTGTGKPKDQGVSQVADAALAGKEDTVISE